MKNYIYGIRTVLEAINSGKNIEKVLFKKNLSSNNFNELFKIVRKRKINYQFVPTEKLNKYTQKNHQGVIAFVSLIEYADLEKLTPFLFESGKVPLYLILDGVTDVRNFGAIARTSECAGIDAIITKEKGSAAINQDAIKTSAGALYKINVSKVKSLNKTVKDLKNSGFTIISATEKGDTFYFNADYNNPTVIIMGGEEIGISNDLLEQSDFLVKIPINGEIKSLNVSNATSIIIYEALKQRM